MNTSQPGSQASLKGTRQTLSLSVSMELLDEAARGARLTWLGVKGASGLIRTNQVQLTLAASCKDRIARKKSKLHLTNQLIAYPLESR